MGPFRFEEAPGGVLRLEVAGKVLKDGADPVGTVVGTLTWGIGNFSKMVVVNEVVKGEEVISTEALAQVSAEAEGFGVFLPEPALGSIVPSAAKCMGEAPEIRAASAGVHEAFSCLQLLGPCVWLGVATVVVALLGFSFSLFNFPKVGGVLVWAGGGTFVHVPVMADVGGTEGVCCSCAPETLGGCAWHGVLVSDWG